MNKSEPTGEVIERRNYMSYSRVSYRNYYRGGMVESPIFTDLKVVSDVLDQLMKEIEDNGYVTLKQYYQFTSGVVSEDDSLVGWRSVLGATITKGRYGYSLMLPNPENIHTDYVQEACDILSDACEDNYEECVQDAMNCLRKTF